MDSQGILSSERTDVIDLIQTILHPEYLNLILPIFIAQEMAAQGHLVDTKQFYAKLITKLHKSSFLKQFILPFEKHFSSEEIQALILFHSHPAMRKLSQYSQELFDPIYAAYREIIKRNLKEAVFVL